MGLFGLVTKDECEQIVNDALERFLEVQILPINAKFNSAIEKLENNNKELHSVISKVYQKLVELHKRSEDLVQRVSKLETNQRKYLERSDYQKYIQGIASQFVQAKDFQASNEKLSKTVLELEQLKADSALSAETLAELKQLPAFRQQTTEKLAELSRLPGEIENLNQQFVISRQQLQSVARAVQDVSTNLAGANARIVSLETISARFEKQPVKQPASPVDSKSTQQPAAPVKAPVLQPEQQISKFHIEKRPGFLFPDNVAKCRASLARAMDLTGVKNCLAKGGQERQKKYQPILDRYAQSLAKLQAFLKKDDLDDETVSEEASSKFLDALDKTLVSTLMVSLYRGIPHDRDFNLALLAVLNEYLASLHVYTKLIVPGKALDKDDSAFMRIIKKQTDKAAENHLVDEVERLPYFMDYIDDGETVQRCIEGSMIVLNCQARG